MKTCLIVDDVEVTRFTAADYMSDLGYKCLEASTKDEALKVIKGSTVDVVLLDWHLGKDLGLDLIQEIRQSTSANIPFIVFSGVESNDSSEKAKQAGAAAFIEKPTTLEKLEVSLAQVSA
jgi:CheY-like chemotaxis protein